MPPKVCQYGPAAHHSRVVTFLLHIFGGFFSKTLSTKENTLKLKREIINTFRKSTTKCSIHFIFFEFLYPPNDVTYDNVILRFVYKQTVEKKMLWINVTFICNKYIFVKFFPELKYKWLMRRYVS